MRSWHIPLMIAALLLIVVRQAPGQEDGGAQAPSPFRAIGRVLGVVFGAARDPADFVADARAQPARNKQLPAQFKKQLRVAQTKQRKRLERFMAVTIADIDRSCRLTPKQRKSLEVGGKGAIERSMAKWRVHAKRFQTQIAEDGAFAAVAAELQAVADDDEEANPKARKEEEEVQIAAAQVEQPEVIGIDLEDVVMDQMVWGLKSIGPKAHDLTNDPLWTKTVARVLTQDQQRGYDRKLKRRMSAQRQAIVSRAVADIDAELLLSAQQREQLTDLLMRTMPRDVINRAPASYGGQMPRLVSWGIQSAVHHVPTNDVEQILSKSQFERWNEFRHD